MYPVRTTQSDFNFLDLLNIIAIILQVKTQMKLDKQASNDDLLRELGKDTDAILQRLECIERKLNNE